MSIAPAARRCLAAGLDFVILAALAAMVVTILGADPEVRILGVRVSISDVWRPILLAAGLTAFRWFVCRDVPILGARPRASQHEQTTWTDRALLPPRFARIALALVVASLWPVRAQLANLRSVPDLEDPLFSAWRVGWFAHQIVTDPAHLFDANIFYPAPLTLTYSDAHLVPSAVGAPLIWLGADPLVVANLLFVLAFPLTALGYFLAAWRLIGDVRAAVLAGLLGAWYPFHFEHISHLELQWFCWIPLAIVALHSVVARGGWASGAALGGAIAAQALSSMYFGLMLAAYLVPFAICLIAGWRIRVNASLGRAAVAAAALAIAPVVILGPPYLGSHAARGDRSLRAVTEFSAQGRDYGIPNVNSATWSRRLGSGRKVERAVFPGVTVLALAAAGMVPPLTVTGVASIVSGALAFDWSLGVNGLTYDEMRALLVPFRGLRAPVRFVILVATSLILLAAYGARRLLARLPSTVWRNAVLAALLVVAWIDLRPSYRLIPVWPQPPAIYGAVTSSMVLAEFPMRYRWNISYMYFSTAHWAKLVNGYSGFLPDTFADLQNALAAFPQSETLALLRQQGATHVTVNCAFWRGEDKCARVLAALDATAEMRLITRARWEGSEVRLYQLNAE